MVEGRTAPVLLAVLLGACGSTVADAVAAPEVPYETGVSAPTGVEAEPTGATEVRVTWRDAAARAERFRVERRLLRRCADNYVRSTAEATAACAGADTAWHEVAVPSAAERGWTDVAALPNRKHAYRVSACAGSGAGETCVASASAEATTFAALEGHVSTADGVALPDLVLTFRSSDGRSASTTIPASGDFRMDLPFTAPGWSEVEVATADPEASPYLPALLRLDALELASQIRLLLIPRTWTVERGTHAGAHVPISLDAAFDAPRAVGAFYQVAPTAERYAALLYTWEAPFPLPVRLDRSGSDRPIEAADSLAWWKGVDHLEEVVGRDLFRPAGASVVGPAVSVRVDRTLSKSGVGTPFTHQPGERRMQDVEGWHGNVAPVASLTTLRVDSARVTLQRPGLLANAFLAGHELIHVLGIGHGCSWPSIMVECAGSNHQPRKDEPTAQDVAYLELLWAILAHRRDDDAWTETSVLAALAGERVLLDHERPFHDPLPSCWPKC